MNPWTEFWQQGHPTTFGEYFKEGYQGPIKDWFAEQFASNSRSEVLLELACGNGALIPMCLDLGLSLQYQGVDLAAVAIPDAVQVRLDQSENIQAAIMGGTSIEALPFNDGSFSIACSVFGIEYSKIEKSIPEMSRVLQKDGVYLAVVHHIDSIVSQMSARAVNEYNMSEVRDFLDQLQIIAHQAKVAGDLRVLSRNPKAEKARKKVNQYAEKYLSNTDLSTANASMFEFVTRGLQFFKVLGQGPQVANRFIKRVYEETLATRERHMQMCSVAMPQDGIDRFVEILSDAGFGSTEVSILSDDKSIIGWALCAHKNT